MRRWRMTASWSVEVERRSAPGLAVHLTELDLLQILPGNAAGHPSGGRSEWMSYLK